MKVSICCITYNHEKFITEAIESFLMQQTDFDFEIVISEDFSTDNTRSILETYQKKYPEKFNIFYNEKNMGVMPNFIQALKACRGKYIALCEGDDYWTDSLKLQKQVDYLEQNSGSVGCFHRVKIVIIEDTQVRTKGFVPPLDWHREIYNTEDFLNIFDNWLMQTGSYVFRNNDIFRNLPEWYSKAYSGDVATVLILSLFGNFKLFPEVMGVYRRHEMGVTVIYSRTKKKFFEWTENSLELMENIDEYFGKKYSKIIRAKKSIFYFTLSDYAYHNREKKISRKYFQMALMSRPTFIFSKWRTMLVLFTYNYFGRLHSLLKHN